MQADLVTLHRAVVEHGLKVCVIFKGRDGAGKGGTIKALTAEEQTRRLGERINDGRKTWKLTSMDLKSYRRWYDYSRARDEMFAATDTARHGSSRFPTTSVRA